jgi:outer membrane scaffolding protein for murein synthesis (MipA/OmpV family)
MPRTTERLRPARAAFAAVAAAALSTAALQAGAFGNLLLIEKPPEATTLAVGPSLWALPRGPGSGRTQATLLPGVDLYTPGGFFASTDTGVGWNLSQRSDLQAGLRLWPQFGRRQADAPAGIAGIGNRLQAEAFANWAPVPVLLLQSGVLAGAGRHHDGVQMELGATSGVPIGEDLLGIGVSGTWANRAWRRSYFGVSAAESAASGLPTWQPGAGWQDVSLTFSAEHKFGSKWRLSGQFIAARLLGAAARSPLTPSVRQNAATLTLWREL